MKYNSARNHPRGPVLAPLDLGNSALQVHSKVGGSKIPSKGSEFPVKGFRLNSARGTCRSRQRATPSLVPFRRVRRKGFFPSSGQLAPFSGAVLGSCSEAHPCSLEGPGLLVASRQRHYNQYRTPIPPDWVYLHGQTGDTGAVVAA